MVLTKWQAIVKISNGWAPGLQIPFKIRTICNPTSFWPFKIQTSPDFRFPLYYARQVKSLQREKSKCDILPSEIFVMQFAWRKLLPSGTDRLFPAVGGAADDQDQGWKDQKSTFCLILFQTMVFHRTVWIWILTIGILETFENRSFWSLDFVVFIVF